MVNHMNVGVQGFGSCQVTSTTLNAFLFQYVDQFYKKSQFHLPCQLPYQIFHFCTICGQQTIITLELMFFQFSILQKPWTYPINVPANSKSQCLAGKEGFFALAPRAVTRAPWISYKYTSGFLPLLSKTISSRRSSIVLESLAAGRISTRLESPFTLLILGQKKSGQDIKLHSSLDLS